MEVKNIEREKARRVPIAKSKTQILEYLNQFHTERYNIKQLSNKFKKNQAIITRILNQLVDEGLISSEENVEKIGKVTIRRKVKFYFAKQLFETSNS